MFTGIVEEIGKVKSVEHRGRFMTIGIYCEKVLSDCKQGDSIATNGVCLTVTRFERGWFEADVMPQTFDKTNLKALKIGSEVNLERAATLSSRLGGHIVQGHVDTIGKIRSIEKSGNAHLYEFDLDSSYEKYIIEQGSVAIDGVSLTVAKIVPGGFSVSLIPQTKKDTILFGKKTGDTVNIECDVIGKYVEKLMKGSANQQVDTPEDDERKEKFKLTEEFLRRNGF